MSSEEPQSLADQYPLTWLATAFTIIPYWLVVRFSVRLLKYLRVRIWGSATKAMLVEKAMTGRKKSRGYRYTVQCALHINEQYTLYNITFQTTDTHYDQYNANDSVDIKYLRSTHKDKEQNADILYPNHLYLADHLESDGDLCWQIYQLVFVLVVASPFIIGFNYGMYALMGWLGPLFNFVNVVMVVIFLAYGCHPCCEAGCEGTVPCSAEYRELRRAWSAHKFGTVITELQYREFLQTLEPATDDAPPSYHEATL